MSSPAGKSAHAKRRAECASFQVWFWCNLLIDVWFLADIVVNARTGYILEGHFVSDDWLALKQYLKSSFTIDVLGSFPVNFILMLYSPSIYGDDMHVRDVNGNDPDAQGTGFSRTNRLLRLVRIAKLFKLVRMFKLAW